MIENDTEARIIYQRTEWTGGKEERKQHDEEEKADQGIRTKESEHEEAENFP